MKFSGFEDIDSGTRAFILISVALAYPAWDCGFDVGVYGRLFFEKVFLAWSVSSALLIVLIFLPKKELKIPPIAWFATVIPTVWLVLALTTRASPDDQLLRHVLTVIGIVAYLACFPYVVYMAVSIAYPDFVRINRAGPRVAIVMVVLFMGAAGYIAGSNHPRLLTCEDFEISGQSLPENCRRQRSPE